MGGIVKPAVVGGSIAQQFPQPLHGVELGAVGLVCLVDSATADSAGSGCLGGIGLAQGEQGGGRQLAFCECDELLLCRAQ